MSCDDKAADLLYEVINLRYERKPVILTTNRPFKEWNEVFPNATCIVTLLDRLLPHADVTVPPTTATGAVNVIYTAPIAPDAVDGPKNATGKPASGSPCQLGGTPVTCRHHVTHNKLAPPSNFTVPACNH